MFKLKCYNLSYVVHRPWMAYIQIRIDNHPMHCSGSIINTRWILSAAHCLCMYLGCKSGKHGSMKVDGTPKDHIKILLGYNDLNLFSYLFAPILLRRPNKIEIHPL